MQAGVICCTSYSHFLITEHDLAGEHCRYDSVLCCLPPWARNLDSCKLHEGSDLDSRDSIRSSRCSFGSLSKEIAMYTPPESLGTR